MSAHKPPIFETVATAYKDVLRVIHAMPVLAGIIIAIVAVFNIVTLLFLPTPNPDMFTSKDLPVIAAGAVQSFLVTPYLIAVHRFILLGEVTGSYSLNPQEPRFLRFWGWSLALTALVIVPAILMSFLTEQGAPVPFVAVLSILLVAAILFFAVRLTILFPAIAVDAPGARVENAFADSKGNFWRIFLIFIVTALPVMLFAMLLVALGLQSINRVGLVGIVLQIFGAFLGVLGYALSVSVVSRIFQALADRVKRAA